MSGTSNLFIYQIYLIGSTVCSVPAVEPQGYLRFYVCHAHSFESLIVKEWGAVLNVKNPTY